MNLNGHKTDEKQFSSQLLLANDLHKSYGPRPALKGLTFSLDAGHILGFLGPNGAGKTTAIRILTTMLEPDKGYYSVAGIRSENPEEIRRVIGVLPENLGLPKQSTGIEYLTFYGQLYGRSLTNARQYGWSLLEEVGLQQRGKSLIGTYSHGMRQRLGIARALVNDPVVVFLDEPTLGLDPRGQQELLGLVKRIAREHKAGVILCSHILSEIEQICDDVVILMSGQVISSGSVSEVMMRAQQHAIRVHVPAQSVASAHKVLGSVPKVTNVIPSMEREGWLGVEFSNTTEDTPAKGQHINNLILQALIRAKIPVLSFESEGGRLQDVFLHLTQETIQ